VNLIRSIVVNVSLCFRMIPAILSYLHINGR